MVKTTRAQRVALKQLYECDLETVSSNATLSWPSYRAMRASVFPGPGCIMIPWRGSRLGIEPDNGYTNSYQQQG